MLDIDTMLRVPKLLILDITHKCNLSCRICDIWQTAKKEEDIDISYIKKVLAEAKSLGIKEVALSGGESLLRKDIFEIFSSAQEIGIKHLGVLSNGILVLEYLDRLKPYLLDNTLSLVISLDSLNPDIHNHIRNSDSAWERTVKALNLLSSLKDKHPQLNFNVITIILKQNLEQLVELTKFIKSLRVNSLQFQALLPNNLCMKERKDSPFWVSSEYLGLLDETIDKLVAIKEKDPEFIKNSVKNLLLIKKYYRADLSSLDVECSSADKTILMSNEGRCTTCFSNFGDLKKENLSDILKSKERIEAQNKVKKCSWPCLLPCFCD
ncbi:MAG: radical SAM protein [Candidatus Omnitrophica bacterium]|jgi:MoaA/NifB/PqqE/SkfB family radical SAM enzyme|nr:radical SAM protein [Candidatus Omnitrophota bacterium]